MNLSDNFAYPKLMKYFEEISALPRGTYNEKGIADYLENFARERGLYSYRDSYNNVLIKKEASSGRENRDPILLQGHTDMVCEKNIGVEHDFMRDPLQLYEEDGWIKARGTTLGADNGVAVAIMLYVLDGGVDENPPIECLFTASEEVGLIGALNFDYSRITAKRMINMDSADESLVIGGCAGGMRSSIGFEVKSRTVKADVAKISVKGLFGGHSGGDIDKGRANANKIMGRVLYELMDGDTELVSVRGGDKDNAIPRECEAMVTVSGRKALEEKIAKLREVLYDGLSEDDKNLSLDIDFEGEREIEIIDRNVAGRIVFLMHTAANGLFEMNREIKDIVEYSRNLGVVKCDAKGAEIIFSSRSSFASRIDASAAELDDYASMLGATIKHYNRYPGWIFMRKSDIREIYLNTFEELFGRRPEITVTHGGLEGGVISQAINGMDIISCGPIVHDLHSPKERMDKKSFENFYSVIKRVIEKY